MTICSHGSISGKNYVMMSVKIKLYQYRLCFDLKNLYDEC